MHQTAISVIVTGHATFKKYLLTRISILGSNLEFSSYRRPIHSVRWFREYRVNIYLKVLDYQKEIMTFPQNAKHQTIIDYIFAEWRYHTHM